MSTRSANNGTSRAASRGNWPVEKARLGTDLCDDLRDITTVEQRLSMMWPLTVEAWSLAGRSMPKYERHEMPVRRLSLGSSN